MNVNEMTGLEIMIAFYEGFLPRPEITNTMPMVTVEVEHGRVVIEATANATHSNPLGGVHGGFSATVLDSVTGFATHTILATGETFGTTDLSIKMCRPIPFNTKMIAEGNVLNVGRNLIISAGHIRDKEGKLYAHATATNMIIRGKRHD